MEQQFQHMGWFELVILLSDNLMRIFPLCKGHPFFNCLYLNSEGFSMQSLRAVKCARAKSSCCLATIYLYIGWCHLFMKGMLASVISAEPWVDNKFELSNISTIPSVVSTKFFAEWRRDSRAQQFDSSHHLHVR